MSAGLCAPAPVDPSRRVRLMGLALDHVTERQAIDHVIAELHARRGGWLLTPNLHILRMHTRSPRYAALVEGATLRVADGMPLIWAARLQGTPLPARIAGSELVWSLSARAAAEGRSVYFLGGDPGAAEACAARLRRQYPTLIVRGHESPARGFERDPAYLAGLRDRLAAASPDICYVGLPVEKSDPLIADLRARFPATWFMGCGISFSYVAGEVRHAPVWIRRLGLEWLFRLCQEPRRLGRRYLLEGLPFGARLLTASAIRRLRARPTPYDSR